MTFLAYATGEAPLTATPEQELWIAVIKQAIFDYAFPNKVNEKNARRRSVQNRANARAWIFFSDEFPDVCALAGLLPDRVRHITRVAAGEVV
jgi:hypothetical protein